MAYDRGRVVADSRAVLARHARTFDLAGWFLPAERLDDAAVVYAFCRLVDDSVDEAATIDEGRAALLAIERELRGEDEARPLVACFAELLDAWGLPRRVALELIVGVRSDAGPVEVQGDPDLVRYCYRVAGTVGLMMCGVLGVRDRKALPFALDLGIAMQLTNISRDVAADARLGRVYLPATRLRAAGAEPAALVRGEAARGPVARVVLELLGLADRYYESADGGLRFIPWRSRLAIVVAGRVYRAIGVRLRRHGGDALAGRTMLPALEKAWWVAEALVRFVRTLAAPIVTVHEAELHRWLVGWPGADDGGEEAPPGLSGAAVT